MNILFIFSRKIIPSHGGVERVTYLLAKELIRRGHEVNFLSVGPENWNTEELNDHTLPQYYIPASFPDFREKYNSFLREKGVDKIIFQSNHNTVVAALDATPEKTGKFLVLHFSPHAMHRMERRIMQLTPWSDLIPRQKVLKLISLVCPPLFRKINNTKNGMRYKALSEKTDKFLFLSDRYVDRVKSITSGIDVNKLSAINNPNTFTVPEKESFSAKENVVILVGRLSHPQKNLFDFIDVWKKFNRLHPDWKALVLGDGEHRAIIERYAAKKRVENFSFEGNRKNIADYYRKAKILCMTSVYEGWPMVLAEAMAYGCVPVAYDSFDAVHDLIENGKNGFTIKTFDTQAMAEALSKLASDESLRERMANAGKEKIKNFTVENITDQWEKLMTSSH